MNLFLQNTSNAISTLQEVAKELTIAQGASQQSLAHGPMTVFKAIFYIKLIVNSPNVYIFRALHLLFQLFMRAEQWYLKNKNIEFNVNFIDNLIFQYVPSTLSTSPQIPTSPGFPFQQVFRQKKSYQTESTFF